MSPIHRLQQVREHCEKSVGESEDSQSCFGMGNDYYPSECKKLADQSHQSQSMRP